MSNDNNTIQCPHGCTHSNIEHWAFDVGREAGRRDDGELAIPVLTNHLRDIWRVGYSVGELEREAREDNDSKKADGTFCFTCNRAPHGNLDNCRRYGHELSEW